MVRKILAIALAAVALPLAVVQCTPAKETVEPLAQGDKWLDTDGNPINAHGAGMPVSYTHLTLPTNMPV